MTTGVKVREGRPLVGGLEERENGSDYAGSDPAPRLRLGSLLGAVSAWVRKTDLVVRGVEIQQGEARILPEKVTLKLKPRGALTILTRMWRRQSIKKQ